MKKCIHVHTKKSKLCCIWRCLEFYYKVFYAFIMFVGLHCHKHVALLDEFLLRVQPFGIRWEGRRRAETQFWCSRNPQEHTISQNLQNSWPSYPRTDSRSRVSILPSRRKAKKKKKTKMCMFHLHQFCNSCDEHNEL